MTRKFTTKQLKNNKCMAVYLYQYHSNKWTQCSENFLINFKVYAKFSKQLNESLNASDIENVN